jgi:diaphanous 1
MNQCMLKRAMQVIDIPKITDRLRCMIYRRRLELDIEEIRPDLDILHSASRELKTSQRFRRVLQVRGNTS